MTQNSRKHRGYRTERVVAEYLRRWWEGASVGRGNGRDILNVPFDCEIKSRTGLDISGTLRQIETRTAKSGLLGFACFRLNGQGDTKPHEYVAMLRLGDLVQLLKDAGYDKRKDEVKDSDINRCICGQWTVNNLCNQCKAYYADL